VPSKCTIVRATGRSADLKQNTLKKQLYSVSVKKSLSKDPFIFRKSSKTTRKASVKPYPTHKDKFKGIINHARCDSTEPGCTSERCE